jgi:hypothetical protein
VTQPQLSTERPLWTLRISTDNEEVLAAVGGPAPTARPQPSSNAPNVKTTEHAYADLEQ